MCIGWEIFITHGTWANIPRFVHAPIFLQKCFQILNSKVHYEQRISSLTKILPKFSSFFAFCVVFAGAFECLLCVCLTPRLKLLTKFCFDVLGFVVVFCLCLLRCCCLLMYILLLVYLSVSFNALTTASNWRNPNKIARLSLFFFYSNG